MSEEREQRAILPVAIRHLHLFGTKPSRWLGKTDSDDPVYVRYQRGWLEVFVKETPAPIYEGELDLGSKCMPFYQARLGDDDDHELSASSLLEYLNGVATFPEWVERVARRENAVREYMAVPLTDLGLKQRPMKLLSAFLHRRLGKALDDLTVSDLTRVRDAEFLSIPGFGEKSYLAVYAALCDRGLYIGSDNAMEALWGTTDNPLFRLICSGPVAYAGDYLEVKPR